MKNLEKKVQKFMITHYVDMFCLGYRTFYHIKSNIEEYRSLHIVFYGEEFEKSTLWFDNGNKPLKSIKSVEKLLEKFI